MRKKQKTMALLLAVVLGNAGVALASPTPTLDVRPVLTQVPQSTHAPVVDELPQCSIIPTVDPTETPAPAPTPVPTLVPERTQTPAPTIPAGHTPQPFPTATARPQPSKKPVLATPAPSTDDDYTTGYVGMQEEIAFLLLNKDRSANGLSPLVLDPELCRIARAKSQDMKTNRYFAHNSPTYGNASQMLKTFGYSFLAVGENIAHHATVEKSQAAFMSSAGHRRNILSPNWTKVGIGVVTDDQGFVYVTQLFVR